MTAARYWMHNNMITINGQKMGKSLGNFITLEELTTGRHPLLATGLFADDDPFFHPAGPLPRHARLFERGASGCRERLRAADESRTQTLSEAETFTPSSTVDVSDIEPRCRGCDGRRPEYAGGDFRPVRLRCGSINQIYDGHRTISAADLERARVASCACYVFDILGLRDDLAGDNNAVCSPRSIDTVLDIRQQAEERPRIGQRPTESATGSRLGRHPKVKDRKDGYRLGVGITVCHSGFI